MSREQRPFSPSLTIPVAGSIPKGLAWPLSGFWDMSPLASSDGQRTAIPLWLPFLSKGLGESFNHQGTWNEAVLVLSREPPAPAPALPAPSCLSAWICWGFPVPEIGREILDRGSTVSQEFLLPLGPLRCGHTQPLVVEVPH